MPTVERGIRSEELRAAQTFHGNVCVPLALGLRVGAVALRELGVLRSVDKELSAVVEVGDHHWAVCLLDGVQWVTGCTLGKENLRTEPLGKFALTLVEGATGRAVRVAYRPEFLEQALDWPLVAAKREGRVDYRPQPGETEALVEDVLTRGAAELFSVRRLAGYSRRPYKVEFHGVRCAACGEVVMANFAETFDGRKYCPTCYRHELHKGT